MPGQEREGVEQQPFDTDEDYRRYFDGRPRLDGAEACLSSRGISLPRGEPDDSRDRETAWRIGHPAPVARDPGERPWGFTGGTIARVVCDVSGEAYLDLEQEAIGMMKRD